MEKNKIYRKFISHKLFKEKYKLIEKDIPNNITSALVSKKTIIKTIAILVNELEDNPGINDTSLYNKIIIDLHKNI